MRTMADACTPANVPDGIPLVAYYVDGRCAGMPVKGRVHVGISSIGTDAGVVGDCEPGNPTPAFWVGWAQRRRTAGVDPTIYCADDSLSDFFRGYRQRDVIAAFQAARVPQPHYWLCKPGATVLPSGVVAVQYALGVDNDRYDLSLVADFWPGVDENVVLGTDDVNAVAAQVWAEAPQWLGQYLTQIAQETANGVAVGPHGVQGRADQIVAAITDLKTTVQNLQVPPADLQALTDQLTRIENALKGA